MDQVKEGDIVQLKSGNPKMTYKTVHYDARKFNQGFPGNELQTGYFESHSLVREEENNE